MKSIEICLGQTASRSAKLEQAPKPEQGANRDSGSARNRSRGGSTTPSIPLGTVTSSNIDAPHRISTQRLSGEGGTFFVLIRSGSSQLPHARLIYPCGLVRSSARRHRFFPPVLRKEAHSLHPLWLPTRSECPCA